MANAAIIRPEAKRDCTMGKKADIFALVLLAKVPFQTVTEDGGLADRSHQVRKWLPTPQRLVKSRKAATSLAGICCVPVSATLRGRLPLYSCLQVSIIFLLSLGARLFVIRNSCGSSGAGIEFSPRCMRVLKPEGWAVAGFQAKKLSQCNLRA